MARHLRPYQAQAVKAWHRDVGNGKTRSAVVLPTGTGKPLAADTPIQTPDGLRRFGDVAVGDLVFGRDGRPTKVTAVFEQGVRPVFRVTFSDRTSVLADAEHPWQVVRCRRKPRVMTTAQLMANGLSDGAEGWRWRIPMADAVQRPEHDLAVPPYTLGALIANGYLHGRWVPILTTPDHDVVARIKAEHVEVREQTVAEPYCPRWALMGLREPIRAMGLAVPSGKKFIPEAYLQRASVAQRVALLRGLMDADGSSRTGGRRSVHYHTTSPQLARDVQELISSLGGTASMNTADRTAEGKSVEYTLHILTPSWLYPFGTVRKVQDERPNRVFEPRRAIVSIEPEGEAPVRCIRVDAPDHLFLIGREYIVTHNTDVGAGVVVPWAQEHGPGSVLAISHRDELNNQMTERFGQHDPMLGVGRWQASRRDARRPITVGSVQTLWNEKTWNAYEKANGRPSLVLVDECHHAVSPGYMNVLRWAGAFAHVPTLGLTATMVRGDRIGLGDVWQSVAFQRDIGWAIREGFLVPPRGKVIVVKSLQLDTATVSKGDYAEGELGSMIEQGADEIVDAWEKHAEGRITASFSPTVEAAYAIADEFNARGIPSEVVVGDTPKDERRRIYDGLARGDIKVLSGVMVTTEGWDCPPASCILQCRPTRLPGLYQQIVGRGLRTLDPELFPDHPEKTDCLVLDCVGASRYQKLTTLVDLYETAEIDSAELDDLFDEDEEPLDDEEGLAPELPKPKLIGPKEYEDIDLFAGSGYVWLFTYGGTRFLPAGDRLAVMWQHPKTGKLRAGTCLAKPRYDRSTRQWDRDGEWFRDGWGTLDGWDLDTARMALESWVDNYAGALARKGATWRKGKSTPPSDDQIAYAARLGIESPELYTKAALSDEISIALASQMLD